MPTPPPAMPVASEESPEQRKEEGVRFLQEVQRRFQASTKPNDQQIYQRFEKIMQQFLQNQLSDDQVVVSIESLFVKHPDLILGFRRFLGSNSTAQSEAAQAQVPTRVAAAPSTVPPQPAVPREQFPVTVTSGAPIHVTSQPPRKRAVSIPATVPVAQTMLPPQTAPKRSRSVPLKVPVFQPPPQMPATSYSNFTERKAIDFIKKVATRFPANSDTYTKFLSVLTEFNSTHAAGDAKRKVEQLFAGHEDLINEFAHVLTTLSLHGAQLPVPSTVQPTSQVPPQVLQQVPQQPVQLPQRPLRQQYQPSTRTGLPASHAELATFAHNRATALSLMQLGPPRVTSSETSEATQVQATQAVPTRKLVEQHSQFRAAALVSALQRATEALARDIPKRTALLRLTDAYARRALSRSQFANLVDGLLRGTRLSAIRSDLRTALFGTGAAVVPECWESFNWSETFVPNSLTEPFLRKLPQVHVNYRQLPLSWNKIASKKESSEIASSVLNDTLRSYSLASAKDVSGTNIFPIRAKNAAELAIFQEEDARFELDVLLHTAEDMLKKLSEVAVRGQARELLSPLDIGFIARVYGNEAPKIMRHLDKNPRAACFVVSRRIKLKLEEWHEAKRELSAHHVQRLLLCHETQLQKQNLREQFDRVQEQLSAPARIRELLSLSGGQSDRSGDTRGAEARDDTAWLYWLQRHQMTRRLLCTGAPTPDGKTLITAPLCLFVSNCLHTAMLLDALVRLTTRQQRKSTRAWHCIVRPLLALHQPQDFANSVGIPDIGVFLKERYDAPTLDNFDSPPSMPKFDEALLKLEIDSKKLQNTRRHEHASQLLFLPLAAYPAVINALWLLQKLQFFIDITRTALTDLLGRNLCFV
ncbi:MAG: hypothetical protein MHM6MM_001161 [Cercozoa sp. M6MM]